MKALTHVQLFATPGLYSPWNSPDQNTGVGSFSLLQEIFPTQGSNPGLPHCKGTLPAEPQGKPKNTRVGSLSLLQQIFLTQESNWSLLHCRQILYQLSYQGRPTGLPWGQPMGSQRVGHDLATKPQKMFKSYSPDCDYVRLHGKGELRLPMASMLLVR